LLYARIQARLRPNLRQPFSHQVGCCRRISSNRLGPAISAYTCCTCRLDALAESLASPSAEMPENIVASVRPAS